MARTFNITDGSTTISLLNTSGYQLARGGIGTTSYALDSGLPSSHLRYVETYNLNLINTTHDAAATDLQSLIALLRKANQYHTTEWQTTPVYITQQTSGETNARYALVYGTPNLSMPDPFDHPFEIDAIIETMGVQIVRGIWQDGVPGSLPTAITMTATDGANDTDELIVANFCDSTEVTAVFRYDASGTSFSANLADCDAFPLWDGDTDDMLYIGSSDGPFHHWAVYLATAGVYDAAVTVEYYSTDAWIAATAGSEYTCYPDNTATDIFTDSGMNVLNFRPSNTWTSTTINSVDAYWVRVDLNTVTSHTTAPTSGADDPYTAKCNYIEFSSDDLEGDVPPLLSFRMYAPGGSSTSDAEMGAISKIIMGAKSRNLTNFTSMLNAGIASTSDWTMSYDTDTTATADPDGPGGYHAACDFGTESSMAMRVTYTGANLLDDYAGIYKAFIRAEQVGDTDGSVAMKLRTVIGEDDDQAPSLDTPTVYSGTHDAGWEIWDMGTIQIPFTEITDTDSIGTSLIFKIMAEQITGSPTVNIADLILIPIDEWSCMLEDPITNSDLGSSALRDAMLELDAGVLMNRTLKYVSGIPAETWYRSGEPPMLEPGRQTRIYFLMEHYPSVWGTGPYLGSIGMQLGVKAYTRALYHVLRGSD